MVDKREYMKMRLQFLEITTEFGTALMLAMEKKPLPNNKRVQKQWGWVWKLSKSQCEKLSEEILTQVNAGIKALHDLPPMRNGQEERDDAYEMGFENLKKLLNDLNAKFSTWQMMAELKQITGPKADNPAA